MHKTLILIVMLLTVTSVSALAQLGQSLNYTSVWGKNAQEITQVLCGNNQWQQVNTQSLSEKTFAVQYINTSATWFTMFCCFSNESGLYSIVVERDKKYTTLPSLQGIRGKDDTWRDKGNNVNSFRIESDDIIKDYLFPYAASK